ncbi:MAG: hypothetical protein MZV70_50060 [Desulfobacterales bacterium]|nr:hypothetical protein [Desulfobacterales bacterium]
MCDPNPELIYEEKIDNITLQLEELVLDALMAALRKIRERNDLFTALEKSRLKTNPTSKAKNPLGFPASLNSIKMGPVQNNQIIEVYLLVRLYVTAGVSSFIQYAISMP